MAATVDPRAEPPPAASHHLKPWVPSLPDGCSGGGSARDRRRSSPSHRRADRLEDLRAKLTDAAGRLGLPPAAPLPLPQQQEAPAPRPWNLRDRKRRPSARAASSDDREPLEKRPLSDGRAPFAVALTAEEVEEDVYALTGARPKRRPRKRPRVVQRQLDTLFPGLWLTEITADAYKVPDE